MPKQQVRTEKGDDIHISKQEFFQHVGAVLIVCVCIFVCDVCGVHVSLGRMDHGQGMVACTTWMTEKLEG